MTWSETSIARALVRQTFNRKYLVVVPNCNWTGHECDLRVESIARRARYKSTPKDWPTKVWKHYYALPKEIWHPDLFAALPSSQSGVLLLDRDGYPRPVGQAMRVECVRRATANRDAAPISPAAAVDIARLASLRMWDAYARLERTGGT